MLCFLLSVELARGLDAERRRLGGLGGLIYAQSSVDDLQGTFVGVGTEVRVREETVFANLGGGGGQARLVDGDCALRLLKADQREDQLVVGLVVFGVLASRKSRSSPSAS
jgi:hypothetical protein